MNKTFENLLQDIDVQEQIDKLCENLKNKKIVIYGAGEFSNVIFTNYNLSNLNIIAITDKKFENEEEKEKGYYNYKCISPKELETFDCDVVLIANSNTGFFYNIVKEIIKNNKNKIEIIPLIKIRVNLNSLLQKYKKDKRSQPASTISPKVSIVLPIYNVDKYIASALESLINQTLEDIEIICVDDCSTDKSCEIALEYAQKDARIKVIKQPKNMGEVVAKHLGAQNAKADYIGTLDPDDWAHPKMYEEMYKRMIETDSDIIACNLRYLDEEDNFLKDRKISPDKEDNLIFSKRLINIINPATINKLIKKEIYINGLNFTERDVWKDLYQYWRCVTLKECKISFINENYYHYRIRSNSITHSPTTEEEEYRSFYKTVDLILNYLITHNCSMEYLEALKERITTLHQGGLKNSYKAKDYENLEQKYNLPSGTLALD